MSVVVSPLWWNVFVAALDLDASFVSSDWRQEKNSPLTFMHFLALPVDTTKTFLFLMALMIQDSFINVCDQLKTQMLT